MLVPVFFVYLTWSSAFGCSSDFVGVVLLSLGMTFRNGTDVDAGNAMKIFSSLGYKVRVVNDQTVGQIQQLLLNGESGPAFAMMYFMNVAFQIPNDVPKKEPSECRHYPAPPAPALIDLKSHI